MPDTNDKIKALYNAASQKFDIGTEQEFRQKLTDSSKRKAFYDAAVSEFDLGTYDEYEKKIGPTQKSIDEGKAMAAKVPSFKDFAAERGVYVPKVGEIIVASDISERLPSLTTKANIAKDVQEAPERIKVREERKIKAQADALKNNTIKALTANGTKFTEGDAAFKKMQESIKSVVDKGAMTLSADAAGNPIYKRSAGIVESLINSFEASRKDIVDSEIFRKSDLAESVKIAEGIIKGIEQDAVPSGAGAEISGMVGSALPLLGRAVIGGGAATKFLPGPAKALAALGSFAATISPSYDQAYKQGAVELYAKGLEEAKRQKRINGLSDELTQQEKEAEMDRAKKEASVSGFAEGIFTAGLSSIPIGAPVAGQAFKKALVNFAKNTAKEVPRNVSLGAASEVIKDVSARNAGYNITTAETLNNVLERSGQDFVTTLAFEVGFNLGDVANVPKYVKAAANNYLSTIPAPEFNNFAKDLEGRGVVEQGFAEKAATEVNKYKDAKSKVASFIPEDDMPSFAGLIEKKTNLENQKKTTDPSFHAKIDEQIAAVDARIKKMQESPNPIFDEVDELTGDTGDAPPVTQEEIEKSIEYADGFAPEVISEETQKKLDRISEIESIISNDDSTFYEKGNRPLLKEARTELELELKSLREEQGITKKEAPGKNDLLKEESKSKESSFKEAGEKSKKEKSPKSLGDFIIDNSQVGDRIKINEEQYFEVVSRKTNKKGFIEIEFQHFVKNEDTGKFENNPSAVKIFTDKYRGTDLEKLGYRDASDLFESAYTNSSGERVVEQSVYQTKKSIEDAGQTTKEAEIKQEIERLRAEEQKELSSAIPNIDEYKTDGFVDRNKITNEEDLKKFDEIYNKYDKLITPLLETTKQEPVAQELPKEPSPFVPLEGFDGFEVKGKEEKKERYYNPDRALAMSTIRQKNRAEQDAIIDSIGEPTDARQVAMIALMGNPNISYESFIKETGFGQSEIKTRRGRQTEVAASPFTRKEGNTIEGVAEFWWENLPEELMSRMDSQDIRNEIIDLLSTYKDQNEIRDAYIEAYAPKEFTDEEAMQYFSRYEEEIVPIEKEWDDWAAERGEKEMALELDENYVDKLIEQYESTTKAVEPAGRKEKGAGEEAGIANVTEEAGVIKGGDVKKYIDEQATREESTDFNGFAKREVEREGFDAEYKSARVEGETKEQYLIRKYCK
jgi:hypothetical protein